MNVFRALGLVEVLGSADAIQAVDVMLKTSEVEFQTWHTKCGGHTTVFVSGDVAAVTEAVERVKTDPPCEIIKTAVISNPSGEAERLVLENRENSRFARAAFEK
ncbi:MAG: BMC domain-containing protein [Lachnospiraceae bacterium]|jgi:ethanolamine utilization protein EutM|nr:BMC domain-containing protein [Lachnospiraceae bacterium]